VENIKEIAKDKIYNSSIIKYINKEQVEEVLKKIHIIQDENEFYKEYGINWEGKEGFHNVNGIFIGPKGTPHTIIHELLHELSSEFDKDGQRIKNGIQGSERYNFANQVNEGLTDYLACKISGEKPRLYLAGNKLFSGLEPNMIKYYNDEDILMKTYLENDNKKLKEFLSINGKENTYEEIYEELLFLSDKRIEEITNEVSKRVDKNIKRDNRKNTIKNIIDNMIRKIKGKDKLLLLSEGKENNIKSEERKEEFLREIQDGVPSIEQQAIEAKTREEKNTEEVNIKIENSKISVER